MILIKNQLAVANAVFFKIQAIWVVEKCSLLYIIQIRGDAIMANLLCRSDVGPSAARVVLAQEDQQIVRLHLKGKA